MAVAYLTSSNILSARGGMSANFSASFDSGATGDDRILKVSLIYENGEDPNVTAITYNGVSLTQQLIINSNPSDNFSPTVEIWTLLNPATGSNTLQFTNDDSTGTSADNMICASVYTGVDQTDPFDSTFTVARLTTDDATFSMNMVADGGVAWTIGKDRGDETDWSPQTDNTVRQKEITTLAAGTGEAYCVGDRLVGSGTVGCGATQIGSGGNTENQDIAIAALSLKPAGAATQEVSSSVSANAVTTGAMSANRPAAGSAASIAVMSGAMSADRHLSANVAATAVATGAMSAVRPASSSVAATAVSSGSMSSIRSVSSGAVATAITTCALTATYPMSANVTATAASQSSTEGNQFVYGSVVASAVTSGAISAERRLSASTASNAIAASDITVTRPAAGSTLATAVTSGAMSADRRLSASSVAIAVTSGAISADRQLSASAAAIAVSSNAMSAKRSLSASAAAIAVSAGAITAFSPGTFLTAGVVIAKSGGAAANDSAAFDSGSTGDNRLLMVGITHENGSDPNITAISYGGFSLTKVAEETVNPTDGFSESIETWALVNPPMGSNTLQLTNSATSQDFAVLAAVYTGRNQTTPILSANTVTLTSFGNDGSMSIDKPSENDFVFWMLDQDWNTGTVWTAEPDNAIRTQVGTGGDTNGLHFVIGDRLAGAGIVNVGATQTGTKDGQDHDLVGLAVIMQSTETSVVRQVTATIFTVSGAAASISAKRAATATASAVATTTSNLGVKRNSSGSVTANAIVTGNFTEGAQIYPVSASIAAYAFSTGVATKISPPAIADIAHVGSTKSTGDGSSPSVALPTGAEEGDLAIVKLTVDGSSTVPSLPAGFTLISDIGAPNSNYGDGPHVIGYKVLGGSEPANYSASINVVAEYAISCNVWRGVDNVDVFDAPFDYNTGPTDSSPLPPCPSVTTVTDKAAIINLVQTPFGPLWGDKNDDDTYTPPAGVNEVVDANVNAGSGYAGHAVGWFIQPTAGATGTRQWTDIDNDKGGFAGTVALRPATTAGGGTSISVSASIVATAAAAGNATTTSAGVHVPVSRVTTTGDDRTTTQDDFRITTLTEALPGVSSDVVAVATATANFVKKAFIAPVAQATATASANNQTLNYLEANATATASIDLTAITERRLLSDLFAEAEATAALTVARKDVSASVQAIATVQITTTVSGELIGSVEGEAIASASFNLSGEIFSKVKAKAFSQASQFAKRNLSGSASAEALTSPSQHTVYFNVSGGVTSEAIAEANLTTRDANTAALLAEASSTASYAIKQAVKSDITAQGFVRGAIYFEGTTQSAHVTGEAIAAGALLRTPPFSATIEGVAEVVAYLRGPLYTPASIHRRYYIDSQYRGIIIPYQERIIRVRRGA